MKSRTKFICQSCGYESAKWVGRCQACEGWNTMVEEQVQARDDKRIVQRNTGVVTATPLSCVEFDAETRMAVGIEEFDRVLGGGLVKSSLVLLGGDPGIGIDYPTPGLRSAFRPRAAIVVYFRRRIGCAGEDAC